MSDGYLSSVKGLPLFKGESLNYKKWTKKFIVIARVYDFYDILTGVPRALDDDETKWSDEDRAWVKRKYIGHSYLTMSLSGKAEEMIQSVPDGDLQGVWNKLRQTFRPDTYSTMVTLTSQYYNSHLKSIETDPDDWFNEMAELRSEINSYGMFQIPESSELTLLMSKVPHEYIHTITGLRTSMDKDVRGVPEDDIPKICMDVKRHLREFWITWHKTQPNKKKTAEVFQVTAITSSHPTNSGGYIFKGKCNNCGEVGHKAYKCPKNKGTQGVNTGTKTVPVCTYCNKKGHTEEQCYKKRNEQEQVIQFVSQVEELVPVCGYCTEDDRKPAPKKKHQYVDNFFDDWASEPSEGERFATHDECYSENVSVEECYDEPCGLSSAPEGFHEHIESLKEYEECYNTIDTKSLKDSEREKMDFLKNARFDNVDISDYFQEAEENEKYYFMDTPGVKNAYLGGEVFFDENKVLLHRKKVIRLMQQAESGNASAISKVLKMYSTNVRHDNGNYICKPHGESALLTLQKDLHRKRVIVAEVTGHISAGTGKTPNGLNRDSKRVGDQNTHLSLRKTSKGPAKKGTGGIFDGNRIANSKRHVIDNRFNHGVNQGVGNRIKNNRSFNNHAIGVVGRDGAVRRDRPTVGSKSGTRKLPQMTRVENKGFGTRNRELRRHDTTSFEMITNTEVVITASPLGLDCSVVIGKALVTVTRGVVHCRTTEHDNNGKTKSERCDERVERRVERRPWERRRYDTKNHTANNYGNGYKHPAQINTVMMVTHEQTPALCFHSSVNNTTGEFDTTDWWLGDTGATTHICNDERFVTGYMQPTHRTLVTANQSVVPVHLEGPVQVEVNDGTKFVLSNCMFVPGMRNNIISLAALALEGHTVQMTNTGINVNLLNDAGFLHFQRKGHLYYMNARPLTTRSAQVAQMTTGTVKQITVDINHAHRIFGHLGEQLVRKTAKRLNWKLNGHMTACTACMLTKAKTKAIRKYTELKATKPGERLFVDITGPFEESAGGYRYWAVATDDFSRYKQSGFLHKRNQIGAFVNKVLDEQEKRGQVCSHIRCDEAGENVKHIGLICTTRNIQVEFTAPNTPQQNGVAERAITWLRLMSQSMMRDADFNVEWKRLMWSEAARQATIISNLTVPSTRELTPHELYRGTASGLYPYLQPFGRLGYVTRKELVLAKAADKSIRMMYLGPGLDRPSDTYRMFNFNTKKVVYTRNVTWAQWHGSKPATDGVQAFNETQDNTDISTLGELSVGEFRNTSTGRNGCIGIIENPGEGEDIIECQDDQEEPEMEIENQPDGVNSDDFEYELREGMTEEPIQENNVIEDVPEIVIQTQRHCTRKSGIRFEPIASETLNEKTRREYSRLGIMTNDSVKLTRNKSICDSANASDCIMNIELSSDPGQPRNYREAMASPQKQEWTGGIRTEYENFIRRRVFKVIKRNTVPRGARILDSRWVLKKKIKETLEAIFRARLVVKGYAQIPGVDYSDSFAPTSNDATTRVIVIIALYRAKWVVHVIDIETAFLEADLTEPVYLRIPEGYEEMYGLPTSDEYVWELEKAMYGLATAPRAFYKKFKNVLTSKEVGMTQSRVDPCMFYCLDDNGELEAAMTIHVDDCAIAGSPETIERIKEAIKKQLSIKDEGRLSKHLGVKYEWDDKKETVRIHQDDYIRDILNEYRDKFGEIRTFPTPGYPGFALLKNDGEPVLKPEFLSCQGKIMFAMKKTCPEISNAVREMAQHMSNPGEVHWKSMTRMMGYLKSMTHTGMTYNKPKDMDIVAFVDSDYATDKETRKSVTGYLVLVGGCLVSWTSKGQPSVTLSSTEAEYVAASICATEIKFIQMLLNELKIPKTGPATMYEDNQGAIYVMNNDQVGQRTKHIDIRHHFVRDMIQDGDILVRYIRSEDNPADIETKNTREAIFIKHAENMKQGITLNELSDRENVIMSIGVRGRDISESVTGPLESSHSDVGHPSLMGLHNRSPLGEWNESDVNDRTHDWSKQVGHERLKRYGSRQTDKAKEDGWTEIKRKSRRRESNEGSASRNWRQHPKSNPGWERAFGAG